METYRIICAVDGEVGDSDCQDRVDRRGVSVVCILGGITPCGALHHAVELVKIREFGQLVHAEVGELFNLCSVRLCQLLHGRYNQPGELVYPV